MVRSGPDRAVVSGRLLVRPHGLACFRLNEAGSSAMVIAKVSLSFTLAVGLRFEFSVLGGRVMFSSGPVREH